MSETNGGEGMFSLNLQRELDMFLLTVVGPFAKVLNKTMLLFIFMCGAAVPVWAEERMAEWIAAPCVKATLEIVYADGAREVVGTDGEWRAAKGCITVSWVLKNGRLDVQKDIPEGVTVVN